MKNLILSVIAVLAISFSANAQSLNGKWKSVGGNGIEINGYYATFYSFSSSVKEFEKAGIIKKGDFAVRNIYKNTDGSWRCIIRLTHKKMGNPMLCPIPKPEKLPCTTMANT